MPDHSRKTVSATEIAALFGESPYLTRWMLYQNFVTGEPLPIEENSRMSWGLKMQPLIAEQSAKDHGFVVEQEGRYLSRGFLGCTRDAIIVDPERGPGALEIKCCFDMRTWMDTWGGGTKIPRHIILQIQQQMCVGDGTAACIMWPGAALTSYSWGLLAVWVCATMHYVKFEAQPELWTAMASEASAFLDDVTNRREPDPAGTIIELPLLAQLYPTVTGKILDWRDDDSALPLVDHVRGYLNSKQLAGAHGKVADSIRAEFIGIMKDADTLLLPNSARVSLSTDARGARRINCWMPEDGK